MPIKYLTVINRGYCKAQIYVVTLQRQNKMTREKQLNINYQNKSKMKKFEAKQIREQIRESHGRTATEYSHLISVYQEYINVKKAIKSLLDRKVTEQKYGEDLRKRIENFAVALDKIRIGAMVNRMAKMELCNKTYFDLIDEKQKQKIKSRCKEIVIYTYTVVATLDRFLGNCYHLMKIANNEASTSGEILVALESAHIGISPSASVIARAQLNEMFAEVEKIYEGVASEEEKNESNETTDSVTDTTVSEAPESNETTEIIKSSSESVDDHSEAQRNSVTVISDSGIGQVQINHHIKENQDDTLSKTA